MARLNMQKNSSGAALVCRHVAIEGMPILLAIHDAPVRPEDSGWQFLCNSGKDEEDAKVWALTEVIEHDPSLSEIVNAPPGAEFIRDKVGSNWKKSA